MIDRSKNPLCQIDPSSALYSRVVARILLARQRHMQIQFALQCSLFFISGLVLVPLAQFAGKELVTSGFYEYALMLTYGGSASALRQEIIYSLIESVPSFSILLIGVCLCACIWSLRHVVRSSRLVFSF